MTKDQRTLWDAHLDALDTRFTELMKGYPSEAERKAVNHCMKRLTEVLRELGGMFTVEPVRTALEFKLQSVIDENTTAEKAGLYEPRGLLEATAELLEARTALGDEDIPNEDDLRSPKRVN